jgi:hypothetical protein
MNTDEKRIRIAMACGWSEFDSDNIPNCIQYTAKGPSGKWGMTPDYFNDLNAMHEAEEKISGNQFMYMDTLRKVCWGNDWLTCHATAAQRAEAFGKTLNLW